MSSFHLIGKQLLSVVYVDVARQKFLQHLHLYLKNIHFILSFLGGKLSLHTQFTQIGRTHNSYHEIFFKALVEKFYR